MLRSVFLKNLRDQRSALLWWLVGVVAYVLFIMLFYPTLQQNAELLNQYLEVLPEAFRVAFVGEVEDITSPAGFLTSYLFAFVMPLLILVYAIITGSAAIAGEEERKTLDLLLANPVSRGQVLLEKAANLGVGVVVLCLATWASVVGGAMPVGVDINYLAVAAICTSLALLGLAFGFLALAAGAALGRRGAAGGIAAAVALFSYLMNSFAPAVETLEPYRVLSLLYYYNGADPLVNGLNPIHVAVLVAFSVLCLMVGLLAFRRRDLSA